MDLKRPKLRDTNVILNKVSMTLTKVCPEDLLGLSVVTVFYSQDISINEFEALLDKFKNKSLFNLYNDFSVKIGKLVRLSEIIHYELDTIARLYLTKNILKDISQRNSKCKELAVYDNTHKFDFVKFSKLISCIINTDDKFHIIDELNSKEKRKLFTKTLYDYIIDRNYYAHGYLFINYPNMIPALSVVVGKSDNYIFIDDEIVENNIKAYLYLEKTVRRINQIISGLDVNNTFN